MSQHLIVFVFFSTKFEEEEMCPNVKNKGDFLMKEFYTHKFPHQFIRKLIEVKNENISSDAVEHCKRNLQYRAEVIFKLATDSMSVTVMSSRLSFFDKMSAFGKIASPFFATILKLYPSGGILGLFTGISIFNRGTIENQRKHE